MNRGRAQSNLLALVAALAAVAAATSVGLALADTAFSAADRPVEDRRVATALSERLVDPASPLAVRANVLDADALDGFDAAAAAAAFPVVGDRPFRLRVDGEVVARQGDPVGGATVRRVVLVRRVESVTRTPALTGDDPATTLPRRTARVRLVIDPPAGTVVTAVRAKGRVVLLNRTGLDGIYDVRVSRLETVRLTFETVGPLPTGSVAVTYFPERTTKAVLEVTVGGDG